MPHSLPALRHFRVDPRLVHATTMTTWVPALSAKEVVVVDDEVFDDPRRRSILSLSAMGAAEVRFAGLDTAAAVLGECPVQHPALVLFSSLDAALAAVERGLQVRRLVIGHLPEGPGRVAVHPAVHLGEADLAIVDQLIDRGVEVVVQALPSDKAIPATRFKPKLSSIPAPPPQRVVRVMHVVNSKGLHLRAAHVLAQLAGRLTAEVHVAASHTRVNAKSLLGLTTLGAGCGTRVEVTVEGPGAAEAIEEIDALFASGFDEGVDWSPELNE
ncbi:MAG: HPr family phosphocarrier protein [Deltaproteobacteria bacterium]|nr:HPr family phosphocarrier protein [Deltaproteobacteria bacterium]